MKPDIPIRYIDVYIFQSKNFFLKREIFRRDVSDAVVDAAVVLPDDAAFAVPQVSFS